MEKKSSIIAIGLTVHNAPVELREKLAVPEAEWPRAIQELCSYPHIEEAAVLSTCNRMEIYVVGLSFHRGERRWQAAAAAAAGACNSCTGPAAFLCPVSLQIKAEKQSGLLVCARAGTSSLPAAPGGRCLAAPAAAVARPPAPPPPPPSQACARWRS